MRYSVNYEISFGIDVTQKEIDDVRASLVKLNNKESIWNLEVDKNSTDLQIAKVIGLANYRVAEAVDLNDVDISTYSKTQAEALEKQDAEYSFWLGFGLGIFGFFMLQRTTKNLYKRGELIWSALDKQNDLCNICGRLITENDEFYFKDNEIFCIKDDPWIKKRSSN